VGAGVVNESPFRITQVVYNADDNTIEIRVTLADGTGDHVLATLPATPPPGDESE
jgi:hypothetical protein